jgi:glutamate formiminotransferase
MSIGSKIREKRRENKYTLKMLSEKCGLSVSFLSDIEKDRRKPSLDRLKDIADSLQVPVYFYERCALREHCVNLADIRRGGYETLKSTGLVDGREPDLGPSELHPTAGATVVGARGPLIAYNVNLATDDIHIARRIASRMRKLRNAGEALIGVKAIAVYLRSRGIAQVSTNITQPEITGIYDVYSFVQREARLEGVEVLESELIGAMREEELVEAAKASMKMQGLSQKRILDYWMRSNVE